MMKTIHTFRIVEEDNGFQSEQVYPVTDMSIHSHASLEDMLYAFERFLQSSGYILPDDSVLDFVVNDSTPTSYKGEF